MYKNKNGMITFLGLDFMFDSNDKLFFIEANSDPGLMRFFKKKYKNCKPLELLINKTKEYPEKKIINVVSKYLDKKSKNTKYVHNFLSKKLDDNKYEYYTIDTVNEKNLQTAYEHIMKNKKYIVYTPYIQLKEKLARHTEIPVINPYSISNICINKSFLYQSLHQSKYYNIPKTFSFNDLNDAYEFMKDNQYDEYIIKPNKGYGGKKIFFIKKIKDLDKIKLEGDNWLIQEKIHQNLRKKRYWDCRTYTLQGKYIAGLMRVSRQPVVNISQKGKVEAIPDEYINILKKASEEVVKNIIETASKN
ncbi:MAG: hypothetical protein GF349_02305 [Candidatus Magasanikbacteria bacterium]|nr:hypothetical protein [Candidatus Magasanikbacteria bacterium]